MGYKILSVKAREVLDSRGIPTVEVEIKTTSGISRAIVPSGASTGIHEAIELRDNEKRFFGKGVHKAVDNVNRYISKEINGLDCSNQRDIDEKLIRLDGTENKSKLGTNAILGVSMAVCRAGALEEGIPLYERIGELAKNKKFILPAPMMVLIEGGKHADNSTDLQEFMIMPMPKALKNFREVLRCGTEIFHSLGKILKSNGYNINVGFEGAYGPDLKSNNEPCELFIEAIEDAGYNPGKEVFITLDPAASEIYESGKYKLRKEGKILDSGEMVKFYENMVQKFPIRSIEDGVAEDDWSGWQLLNKRLGDKIQIVGDDLTVTNIKRLQKAVELKAINAILIKLNQIGTVSETIDVVNLAKKNKIAQIISHRSGETEDTFIADMVVGLGCGQCKFGGPDRGERTAKYNQLLRIEEELGNTAI